MRLSWCRMKRAIGEHFWHPGFRGHNTDFSRCTLWTPRENVDPEAVQLFGHEIEVRPSIAVSSEDGYGSYTALSDVMGISGSDHSGNSRHAQTLVQPKVFGQEKISIVSPESSFV